MKQQVETPENVRLSDPAPLSAVPLVIALEGALLAVDLKLEAVAGMVSRSGLPAAVGALLSGELLGCDINPSTLPYRPEILEFIRNARAGNRPVYLASDADPRQVQAIADHLQLFDRIIRTVDDLDGQTFDYAGSNTSNLSFWQASRQTYGVAMDGQSGARLKAAGVDALVFSGRKRNLRAIVRLLRPHQYAKNALVLVPLLTSHQLSMTTLVQSLMAFLAFCFAASAVYVLNDFIDMQADRAHPTKKNRPFAEASVSPLSGLALIPLLLAASVFLAMELPSQFSALLAAYLVLTTAYSFVLKRMMLVDVTVLALLYTLRVVAGAAAIAVPVSEWLFAFALLMFTALALIKRYVELSARLDRDLPDPTNRDYKITDLPIIAALAAAAGMNAITILALYVNSANVTKLYGRPEILWLLCPLFLYWVSRTLLLAHRRLLHDDPIVFALKDRASWVTGALSLVIVVAAM